MEDRHHSKAGLGLKELIAMGVGGMVGGGIFSVLGLSVSLAGHAAPIAFALGGIIALLTGVSYSRLGLAFRSDGGSFTYLEHAFRHPNIAGLGGWLLLAGYIGTLALYAYTFGVYGAAMLGTAPCPRSMNSLPPWFCSSFWASTSTGSGPVEKPRISSSWSRSSCFRFLPSPGSSLSRPITCCPS